MLTTSLQLVVAAYPLTLTKDILMSNQYNEAIIERIYDDVCVMPRCEVLSELSLSPLYEGAIEMVQDMLIDQRFNTMPDYYN